VSGDPRQQVADLLNEMAALRAVDVPPPSDPAEVHRVLREVVRPALDRAEVILAEVAGHRRRAQRDAKRAAAVTADAYDTALVKLSTRAMAREYESIRDREVQARTASSPQRKNQHAAEEAADVIAQAEEAARGMFFGLRDIRRELLATLEHYIPWESSLER
jgi:cobalamin-dependent methionine synthase I